jgi:hypothetical protein
VSIQDQDSKARMEAAKERYFRDEADQLSLLRKELARMRDEHAFANEVVRSLFGTKYSIDEMALVSRSAEWLMSFLKQLVSIEGYELFNRADDIVETFPICSNYVVEYWFLRTPFDYRLELMRILNGHSPVHHAIFNNDDEDPLAINVHASFKVPDLDAYTEAQAVLRKSGMECAQKCESTYGRFSYFINEDVLPNWYLKPRVNLRDADIEIGAL